jgi:hypothetical protein
MRFLGIPANFSVHLAHVCQMDPASYAGSLQWVSWDCSGGSHVITLAGLVGLLCQVKKVAGQFVLNKVNASCLMFGESIYSIATSQAEILDWPIGLVDLVISSSGVPDQTVLVGGRCWLELLFNIISRSLFFGHIA